MNPYAILGSGVATTEAAALCTHLTAWHDAMVAHERRLRSGRTIEVCDEACPHSEAKILWAKALATFGSRAYALTFLRSRGVKVLRRSDELIAPHDAVSGPDDRHRSAARHVLRLASKDASPDRS
jgi:hypothetical protein